ncbi:MAG: rhodanese-related sulfurtransferase [Sphingomonas sp.]|nr:rhodanese-related sulfurtransferase [Sphingomonas sp.]
MPDQPIHVAAFYRFAPIADPQALAQALRAQGAADGLVGSIILAREGLNGTIAGTGEAVDALLARLRAEPGCAELTARRHRTAQLPFARWKIKVKPEIVTMGVAGIDPTREVGTHVPPAQWNALISDPDTILIDTRNDYEVAIGTFEGAIDPQTARFGDFPAWFDAQAEQWRAEGRTPRIAMFCTGGIRCEKSTAFVRARGFDDVYHLQGGILAYLAEIEEDRSLWRGECFVFDERVSLTHGEREGASVICPDCGQPRASSAARCPQCAESGEAIAIRKGGALP